MAIGLRRTRVIASLATLAALAFLFSMIALAPNLLTTASTGDAPDNGVTFTFTNYRCLGETNDIRSCRWFGTVSHEGNIEATDVQYRDEAPEGVSEDSQVPALWSFRDPASAWNIQSARAWLSTISSAILSALLFLLFLVIAVIWWRRAFREARAARAQEPKPTTKNSNEDREKVPASGS